MLAGNPNLKMQFKFSLSATISKVVDLGLQLLIDKDIFAVNSVNNSHCKQLF